MTPREFLRELVYPVTHGGLAVAIVCFAALALLAVKAGLFGLWLAVLLSVGGAKYLLAVLRARALGEEPPVAEVDLFNPATRLWMLGAWAAISIASFGAVLLASAGHGGAANVLLYAAAFLFPAAALRLAVTQSPLEMLRPLALLDTIGKTGATYGWIFAAAAVAALVNRLAAGLPELLRFLAAAYQVVLLFSLSGAVFYSRRDALGLPVRRAPEVDAARRRQAAERERRSVLDHAYAHVSRGNGPAGLAYVRQWLERNDDGVEAWRWFFDAFGEWESTRAQINFGRDYIARLGRAGAWEEALAVLERCLALDGSFRPRDDDRKPLLAAAERHGRAGLAAVLRGEPYPGSAQGPWPSA
ncbi:hypothetical protein [Lentisalinibacter orientalis]|uniref:hypothetical protein n=1 Tax=Lentisalinibacter orientalis TaxID=2992241 RepID=UPI00386A3996